MKKKEKVGFAVSHLRRLPTLGTSQTWSPSKALFVLDSVATVRLLSRVVSYQPLELGPEPVLAPVPAATPGVAMWSRETRQVQHGMRLMTMAAFCLMPVARDLRHKLSSRQRAWAC